MGRVGAALIQTGRTLRKNLRISTERVALYGSAQKRFGYIGGHGQRNLGDEAMYEAVRRLFAPAGVVSYVAPSVERNLRVAGLSGPRFFHGVFLGGGTLIAPFPYWIEQTRLALEQGLPVSSLGTGAGSFGFDMARQVDLEEWPPLLRRFQRVGVRGPLSQAMLMRLGIDKAEIVGDLALSATVDALTPAADPPRVAVNISLPRMEDYGRGDYAVLTEVEAALRSLVAAGWEVIPVAMAKRDVRPLTRLLNAVGLNLPVTVIPTMDEFFTLIAPCTFAIAVRLHTAVLACCVGVPPLLLGYRDKCADFMESMPLSDFNIRLENYTPGHFTALHQEMIRQSAALRPETLAAAQRWRQTLRRYAAEIVCPDGGAI